MATISRIKRSETAGNPPSLAQGELAYSSLPDNGTNGGDRLYIGTGTETGGDAVNHVVIGGKFFTDKLDHTNGVVTADSALVVDSNKKLDELNVDNVTINGNTVSTTDTNGDLILAPNGTGKVVASGNAFPNTQGIADQYLKTDGAGTLSWSAIPSGSFTIAGDTGTDVFTTGETLTVVGGTDLTSVVTDNTITINADASLARRADVTYVGTTEIALNRVSGTQDLTGISALVLDGSTSGITTLVASAVAGEETITLPAATGTVALTNQKLNAFAATTSSELAGVISDETGSGALVFGTSPTLVTPNIGAATADSITGSGALSITASGVDANVTLVPTGAGSVDVSNKRITSVAEPTQATDAATKSYVDSKAAGLDVKESVKVATTGNITLIGLQTVDGVGLSNGDRVLVKNQATASENGIYVADTNSWTRSIDANDSVNVTPGLFTFVEQGATQADTGWTLSTDDAINLNVTDLTFTQFSSAGVVVAGAGLTKTGNTLDVVVGGGVAIVGNTVQLDATVAGNGLTLTSGVLDVVGAADRITASANAIDIASTYAGQASITTVGTLATGELGAGFTTVAVAQGGTGATTLTARGVVIGNGTSAVSTTAAASIDGSVLMSDATGNPYWSNVIDGGTY